MGAGAGLRGAAPAPRAPSPRGAGAPHAVHGYPSYYRPGATTIEEPKQTPMTINGCNSCQNENSEDGRATLIAVSATLTMVDGSQGRSVTADFQYNPQQPYAVRMTLGMLGSVSVTWYFSRDLLRAGLMFPVGIGDVRIKPHPYGVIIDLCTPAGTTTFFSFPEPLVEFIGRSLRAVPEGSEDSFFCLEQDLDRFFPMPARSSENSDGASSEG